MISPTGTPQASATSALMPLSPTRAPFSATCEITDGLYVCESTEPSPEIDPWYPTMNTTPAEESSPCIMYSGLCRPDT